MTDQQKRFADRYFETLNGAQSAIFAGYSEDRARQTAYDLLQVDEISEYILQLKAEYQDKNGITPARVLNEYRKIAFSDVRNILTVDGGLKDMCDIDDDSAGAISSVESMEMSSGEGEKLGTNRKIKMHDKLRALDALSRHLGIFKADNEQKPVMVVTDSKITFK